MYHTEVIAMATVLSNYFYLFFEITLIVLVRFYTSIDLADSLLEEFQMTCVGTLAANRKGLPSEFKKTDGRQGLYFSLKPHLVSPSPICRY
jgi:hypothetical protein